MITQKILVVDDEATICRSVEKILSRKGYAVESVLTVNDALKKMSAQSFDLVITDLMIPTTSGMELLKLIHENYSELEVIMITGYASITSAVEATKLGVSSYLQKPFTPDELTQATESALQRKQTKKEPPVTKLATDETIDVDLPFSMDEVTRATSPDFVEALTHTDLPLAKKVADKGYCHTGKRDCRRVLLEKQECAGECPLTKKERAHAKPRKRIPRQAHELIDVDLPFDMAEVSKYVDPDYIQCMTRSDIPLAGLYHRNEAATYSVLVVDNEPIVCHSVRRILSKQSCAVEEAFDVEVALRKMKLSKYDLVLLDLKMPKQNGMEVLDTIKNHWPDLPVVMVTGFGSIETAIEAIKKGADDFLPKPFTPDELTKVAMEVLVD